MELTYLMDLLYFYLPCCCTAMLLFHTDIAQYSKHLYLDTDSQLFFHQSISGMNFDNNMAAETKTKPS